MSRSLPNLILSIKGNSNIITVLCIFQWASLTASVGKESAWIRSLGWEDPLEKEMATHSSILAWRIPMDRGTWQATVHVLQIVRDD